MLDEFSSTKIDAKETAPTSSGPGRPAAAPVLDPLAAGVTDEDFAKQLQAGMADLLGGLETSVLYLCLITFPMLTYSSARNAGTV
jgi:peroxin-19